MKSPRRLSYQRREQQTAKGMLSYGSIPFVSVWIARSGRRSAPEIVVPVAVLRRYRVLHAPEVVKHRLA